MYLGITLNRLGDFESSCQAFEKAIELEKNDCTIFLNYAIVLYNNGKKKESKSQFLASEEIFKRLDEDDKEPEMLDQREALAELLGIKL
jgi:lipoprotein NlpI